MRGKASCEQPVAAIRGVASPPFTASPAEVLVRIEQDGLDLSLLRERLRLTPAQRLQRHQAALALVEALRHAKRKARRAPDGAAPDRSVHG